MNGGTAGYSTDQEMLFYETEGHRYQPRVVVLFFYYNDVVYNDRQEFFGRSSRCSRWGKDGCASTASP